MLVSNIPANRFGNFTFGSLSMGNSPEMLGECLGMLSAPLRSELPESPISSIFSS
jgi:hypothetical protein